jgi:transcription initiation factor TFIID subunit 15
MGDIPANTKMVSAVMVNPQNGQNIAANTNFDIAVKVANLQAGSFTNPDNTYYAAPQALNGGGQIVGHTHVTVQDLGTDPNPTQPLDASTFAFFKGINDAGDGQGLLKATVSGGLKAGNYRVCSLTSASNHQPVIMPVAQRGAQDDCVRFTVGGNGGNAGNANAGNANAGNANAGNANAGNANAGNANAGKANAGNANAGNANAGNANAGNANAGNANAGNANAGNAAAGNANAGKAQNGQQAANGQQAQKGQQAQNGQQAQPAQQAQKGGKGRGRFGRTKFAARDFIA